MSWIPDAWNNVMVFLTPWLKTRRNMMHTFVNENGTKLLHMRWNMAHVRTRGENLSYYTLKSGLFGVKLIKQQYLDSKGEHRSLFVEALVEAFAGEKSGIEKAVTETVCKRLGCFTKKACQEFLDEIVGKTPDMDWWGRDEKDSIILDEEERNGQEKPAEESPS